MVFTLTGQVTLPSGAPFVGFAQVTPLEPVRDTAGHVVRTGAESQTLDTTGSFTFTNLPDNTLAAGYTIAVYPTMPKVALIPPTEFAPGAPGTIVYLDAILAAAGTSIPALLNDLDIAVAGVLGYGGATDIALSATYARRRSGYVVGFGDSHIEGTSAQGTPADWRTNKNYPFGASLYARAVWHSAGRLVSVGNYGVGGERSDQVLARLSEPLSTVASVAIVCVGTNDARQGISLATTRTNIAAIISGLRAGGIEPVMVELPPLSNPPDTDAIRDAQDRINAWLRAYCLRNLVRFVGITAPLIDPATRYFGSGMSSGDGVHLSSAAVDLAGKLIADACADMGQAVTNWLTLSSIDAVNWLSNALGLTDATADGIPDGWSTLGAPTGGTVTHTLETVTGWQGKAFAMAQAGNTNTRQLYQNFNISGGKFAVGDRCLAALRAKTTSVGAFAQLIFNGSTASQTQARIFETQSSTTADQLTVHEFVVPAGTTSIDFRLGASPGTGKVWFGQPTLLNLTQLGLT